MDVFITRALKKIKKEATRKQKNIRDSCDAVLEALQKHTESGAPPETDGDKYFEPLKLACQSKNPRMMEASLDCIQKLLAYNYLRGEAKVEAPKTEATPAAGEQKENNEGEPGTVQRTMMDEIIEVICSCNDSPDDNVQLQVIKALLTAVTSQSCQVHESSLLLAVRACYHIHLVSKNMVNKTTAKAILTQMLNSVFQKMEVFHQRAFKEEEEQKKDKESKKEASSTPLQSPGAISRTPEAVTPRLPNGEVAPSPASTSPLFGSSMYPSVEKFLGYRDSTPVSGVVTPQLSPASGGNEESKDQVSGVFPSIFHKDAFLLFRSLCKISMKALPDDPNQAIDPIALQSKILSLELIQSILENAGPSFRSGEKFIYAIRQYLCISLIKNCTSNITQIINLSLRLFVVLIKNFKDHLKAEFEVFISNIFLRILESPNSTFEHKMLVLEVFYNLSQDALILVEIFLNYDCDWDSMDLFRRIVNALAKVAKGRAVADLQGNKRTTQEETALKNIALESLANILKSLNSVSSGTDDHLISHTEAAAQLAEQEKAIRKKREEVEDDDKTDGAITAAVNSMSVVESYDRKQRIKEELQTGILKFNLKPAAGIQYLVEKGHLEKTPKSVAKFLHDHADELNKTEIGDYLGREAGYQDGFCIKVLHEYVDQMDFTSMVFDNAIRHFLSGFRLPGEAQKIDRIMEKFAERYCINNPGVFPSADTAFILAFSVIMLNTDLHNPSIQENRRMTKEGFIKNNRGISSNENLPDEFLMAIYDRIQQNEITLKDDEELRAKQGQKQKAGGLGADLFGANNAEREKQKREAFTKEREAMVQMTEAMFKRRGTTKKTKREESQYLRAEQMESAVRPMFEVAWTPVLAVLSIALETSDDPPTVALCLRAFRHAIRISATYGMATERNAYVTSLAKFTTLDTVKEMRPKNLECIKALIAIALTEGNYLGESWAQVLQCVSQLARLQMFAMGLQSDDKFFPLQSDEPKKTPGRSSVMAGRRLNTPTGLFSSTPSREEVNKAVEEANAAQILHEVDFSALDRIFSSSVTLSSEGIQDFVEQLCNVSMGELSQSSAGYGVRVGQADQQAHPRVFSLQKIVEVADYNMNARPRVIWARVWETLSRHFTLVGCHENVSISMFAIDSLRQLAFKFLEKDELRDFHFQKLFLRPFEVIVTNTNSAPRKELILVCLEQLIIARSAHIRSGWKTIFGVYNVVAADPSPELVKLAFQSVDRIMKSHFEAVVDVFVDLVRCLHTFAGNKETTEISLQAIQHLQTALKELAEGRVIDSAKEGELGTDKGETSKPSSGSPQKGTESQFNDSDGHIRVWWPLLTAFAALADDPRPQVSDLSLDSLFHALNEHGHRFSPGLWALIFRGVISPLFDDVRHSHDAKFSPTVVKTCDRGLQYLVELFSQYFDTLAFLLEDVLKLLHNCICRDNAELSSIGVRSLRGFIQACGHRFPLPTWSILCSEMEKLFEWATPKSLLSISQPLNSQSAEESSLPSSGRVRTQLGLLLQLQEAIGAVVTAFIAPLSQDQCERFLKVLYASFYFARDFNNKYELRVALQNAGLNLSESSSLPDMLSQEVRGMTEALRILFCLSADDRELDVRPGDLSSWDHRQFAEEQLVKLAQAVITEYVARDEAMSASPSSGEEASERSRQEKNDAEKIITALGPVVSAVLKGFNALSTDKLRPHLSWLYPLLGALVVVDDRTVRTEVRSILLGNVSKLALGANSY